jgi:hypothetical protein
MSQFVNSLLLNLNKRKNIKEILIKLTNPYKKKGNKPNHLQLKWTNLNLNGKIREINDWFGTLFHNISQVIAFQETI